MTLPIAALILTLFTFPCGAFLTAGSLSMSQKSRPHVAVVGAGWGGFGAAKALAEAGCKVTLLDGLPDPTGATVPCTPTGKPFEAGVRGFWKDYPNICSMLGELGIREDSVFTPFTNSSFYSPEGLEATAPVFSASNFPELPSPLGQVLATFQNFERLPLADRASMVGLLYAMLDFQRSPKIFEAYDRMTAHELFLRMGLSKRLVDDFIRPTLLVGLFKPPEELSAAVAMELLYYYALAHQDSFDVRWMRKGTVTSELINPLATKLEEDYGLEVKGGCFVEGLVMDKDGSTISGLKYREKGSALSMSLDADAFVLSLGAKGMNAVMKGSPEVAKRCVKLSKAASLDSIDVVSVRLWLDGYVATRTPANVFSRFEQLRGAGGTFFMLDQLHGGRPGGGRSPSEADYLAETQLWGGEQPKGSVVACDFYNAAAISTLCDEDIVSILIDDLLPFAVPAFAGVRVVDSFVQRYPKAVSWFSPGSFDKRPPLAVPGVNNLVCAGDWVKMGEREHGAKGLCQERAYVSGLEAGNMLMRRGAVAARKEHAVIPVRPDEPQVKLGRSVNQALQGLLSPLGLDSPWVR